MGLDGPPPVDFDVAEEEADVDGCSSSAFLFRSPQLNSEDLVFAGMSSFTWQTSSPVLSEESEDEGDELPPLERDDEVAVAAYQVRSLKAGISI